MAASTRMGTASCLRVGLRVWHPTLRALLSWLVVAVIAGVVLSGNGYSGNALPAPTSTSVQTTGTSGGAPAAMASGNQPWLDGVRATIPG